MATEPQIAQAEIEQEKTHDASDEKSVAAQRSKAGRHRKKMLEMWEGIMSLPAGREFVYSLLVSCDVFRTTYVQGEDERAHAFREGKRYIGNQILADIKKANFTHWVKMEQEALDKKWPTPYPLDGID